MQEASQRLLPRIGNAAQQSLEMNLLPNLHDMDSVTTLQQHMLQLELFPTFFFGR